MYSFYTFVFPVCPRLPTAAHCFPPMPPAWTPMPMVAGLPNPPLSKQNQLRKVSLCENASVDGGRGGLEGRQSI